MPEPKPSTPPSPAATKAKAKFYLCLHGHFYQPPRENPWIEAIELQESAAPFHDWNDRIHHECYLPNSKARILDKKGNVLNIVNNYERMSFNFGPTLLSWIEEYRPETYSAILHADKTSILRHNGHGNAIAQVYNHVIMPLANRRDKVTQTRWGLWDFKHRFGRDPESVWLPETACDEETLEVLIDEGIKYIILEPHQAQSVRELTGKEWINVSNGSIDPKIPYRCFLRSRPDRYVDVFFYDGPISKAIGFDDLLFDAKRFMNRIEEAKANSHDGRLLINLATDGETYGHHKPFGDRVLAYLTSVEAGKRGFEFANYGRFLEENPPRFAVLLKEGDDGLGTSWSCAHGVKRWKEHCGCRGGGPAEWNQQWRKPLRDSLDWLRDRLAEIFEKEGSRYFNDVWHARNQYIGVILDRSKENIEKFLNQHAKEPPGDLELTACLELLEMQRNAMLMYTSCGWFFSEISGLETVQILQYAARAIQLAKSVSGKNIEDEFLERLSEAKSNIAEFKDGRGVYETYVRPAVVDSQRIVGHYAISSIFRKYPERFDIYCYEFEVLHQRTETHGNLTFNMGRVKIRSKITLKEEELFFGVLQFETYDFRCSVQPFDNEERFKQIEKELFNELHSIHLVELMRNIDQHFGKEYYSLKDVFLDERIHIISILTREAIGKINETYQKLFEENRRMNEVYSSIRLPIPQEIRYAIQYTLNHQFRNAIVTLAEDRFDLEKKTSVLRLMDLARIYGVTLRIKDVVPILTRELAQRTGELTPKPQKKLIQECLNLYHVAQEIGVALEWTESQEHLLALLSGWQRKPEIVKKMDPEVVQGIYDLARAVRVNPDEFKIEIEKAVSDSKVKAGQGELGG